MEQGIDLPNVQKQRVIFMSFSISNAKTAAIIDRKRKKSHYLIILRVNQTTRILSKKAINTLYEVHSLSTLLVFFWESG